MRNTNKEVPSGRKNLLSAQNRKRERTPNTNESENTLTRTANMNNITTSVSLSKLFPRVLSDISNIHPQSRPSPFGMNILLLPWLYIYTLQNDCLWFIVYVSHNGNQRDDNALAKRFKSTSDKNLCEFTISSVVICNRCLKPPFWHAVFFFKLAQHDWVNWYKFCCS